MLGPGMKEGDHIGQEIYVLHDNFQNRKKVSSYNFSAICSGMVVAPWLFCCLSLKGKLKRNEIFVVGARNILELSLTLSRKMLCNFFYACDKIISDFKVEFYQKLKLISLKIP